MPFFALPAEAIRFVFDLNFLGTLLPSQVFGKEMVERDIPTAEAADRLVALIRRCGKWVDPPVTAPAGS